MKVSLRINNSGTYSLEEQDRAKLDGFLNNIKTTDPPTKKKRGRKTQQSTITREAVSDNYVVLEMEPTPSTSDTQRVSNRIRRQRVYVD